MVKLDIARNRILTAELVFSMASTCLTVGALVSGIFGKPPPLLFANLPPPPPLCKNKISRRRENFCSRIHLFTRRPPTHELVTLSSPRCFDLSRKWHLSHRCYIHQSRIAIRGNRLSQPLQNIVLFSASYGMVVLLGSRHWRFFVPLAVFGLPRLSFLSLDFASPPPPRACFFSIPNGLFAGNAGMNLQSGVETNGVLFNVVAIGTVCLCTIGFCGVFTFFYRHGILVS